MSSPKPTIVFGPGAWHTPSSFDPVKERLEAKGYTVVGVTWPSVGAEPPSLTLADDVAVMRSTLEKLAGEGTDIMLITHSYGGAVASNSLKGLGSRQRAAAGEKGGVVMNMYISSFVIPLGLDVLTLLPGGELFPWMKKDGDYVTVDGPEKVFYHDLSAEAQEKAIAALQHQCFHVYDSKTEYEPWHDITSSFLVCDDDAAIPQVAQEGMASLLGSDAQVYHIKSSHSPFLSKPDETAEIIEKAAAHGMSVGK